MNNGWQQAVFLLSPIATPHGKRLRLPWAAEITSRRNNQCVATQQQIRRDVIPATSCPIK